MHGCSQWGACMVAPGGACVVALGVCVVARGGGAWLLLGFMRGCSRGGMHGIRRDTEIRSMSRRYASYWNAFLFNFAIDC